MKVDIHNIIIDKANEKADGVFSYKGIMYAVKSGRFIGYADKSGFIFSVHGNFVHNVGRVERWERKQKLLEHFIRNNNY